MLFHDKCRMIHDSNCKLNVESHYNICSNHFNMSLISDLRCNQGRNNSANFDVCDTDMVYTNISSNALWSMHWYHLKVVEYKNIKIQMTWPVGSQRNKPSAPNCSISARTSLPFVHSSLNRNPPQRRNRQRPYDTNLENPWSSESSFTAQTEVIIPIKAEVNPVARNMHPTIRILFEREAHIYIVGRIAPMLMESRLIVHIKVS